MSITISDEVSNKFYPKNPIQVDPISSETKKRIEKAAFPSLESIFEFFKHLSLGILKMPLLILPSSSGNKSWEKEIQAHFHQAKMLLNPEKSLQIPPHEVLFEPPKEEETPDPIPVHSEETIDPDQMPVADLHVKIDPPPFKPYLDKIERLRREKIKSSSLRHDADHRLERKAAKAELSCLMNQDAMVSTGKGVNGSQFVKFKGKKIGVFKSIPDVAQGTFLNIVNPFGQQAYLNRGTMAQAAAERAAYLLAKELNHQLLTVPAVKIMDLDGKKGCFAVFEKGIPADQIIQEIDGKSSFSRKEINIFQIFIIFDYLLGNLDRHLENWLIKVINNCMGAIYPIDHANSFPLKKPNWLNLNAAKNVYKWKELELAKFPLTKEIKSFIEGKITDEMIQKVIQSIDEDEQIKSCYPQGEKFLSEQSRKDFEFRALKLRQLLVDNKKATAKDLAQY